MVETVENMSLRELTDLQAKIEAIKPKAMARERDAFMDEIARMATSRGLAVKDMLRGSFKKPVAAKYRDPKSGATWSGRGRSPRWVKGDRDKYAL